ncbi:MAG: putative glycoside hydrolase [Actinomycetota bacterium]|nr:putative glycoside hydrolase [Actinomycetota bacterium]
MAHFARISALAMVILSIVAAGCTSPAPLDASSLRPPEVGPPTIEVVVLAGDDLSVLDADITVEGASMIKTEEGVPAFVWPQNSTTIQVSAPGFEPKSEVAEEPPREDRIEIRLEPVVLSGRVSTHRGIALPGVEVVLGEGHDVTNDDGLFEIVRAAPGELVLTRPTWQDASVSWDGSTSEIDTTMEPLVVHGVRVGGPAAGDPEHWQRLLAMADSTGINAFVVDIKDEFGTVFYDSTVDGAHEASAVTLQYDLSEIVSDMDDHDLYKIARVVAFQDTPMARTEPDHAVLDESGADLWLTRNGDAWMDPTDPVSYEYPVALAEEACEAGFDEIQFDFASFPFGGDVSTAVFDDEYTEEIRVASIQAFLKRAYLVLSPRCGVAASVLGITLESGTDEGVGQRPGLMSRAIDVLSPMLYSTNYGSGWKGYADPNDHAGDIVESALVSGLSRLEGFAYYRPWLQTWTISAFDVRGIQRRVDERANGWLLWSNAASYPAEILPPP